MLQNTGHYGPNDVPVNIGAPVNVSQVGSPMNVVQNLNNLGKMQQNAPQAPAGHFGLPNYPSFAGGSQNMGSQIQTFPNHLGLGLPPHYMPQSSSMLPNSSWQNGVRPPNLNTHSENIENVSNYPYKDTENVNTSKEQNRATNLQVKEPQFTNNFFQKQFASEGDSPLVSNNHIKAYESLSNDINSKPQVSLLNDNNRRKNLENTVRLIENILINTTKNREIELENESKRSNVNNDETVTNDDKDCIIKSEGQNNVLKSSRESTTIVEVHNSQSESNNSSCSTDVALLENNVKKETTENIIDTSCIKIEIEQQDVNEVEVKIEQVSSWVDTENSVPFHRDVNGVFQEDVGCSNIIESESSVAEATKLIENNVKTDSYFECPYCSLLFRHPKRFLIHTKWHSFGLVNEKGAVVVKEKGTRKQRKDSRMWPCKDCDKVFLARGGLESHRKRFHSMRTRDCQVCSKTITGWGPWKAHLKTHNRETGFQCPLCPKRFKHPNSLTKHKDTHLEKTHECPTCPKKFGSPALLKVHMKSHERLQKGASFHCSFCGKSFFDKFNMQIHERTHTNERPFVCDICNASFRCNSNLSRHMKVSHNSNKPYQCPTCCRSFTTEGIRDRHELRAHGDPEEFKYTCDQCPGRFMKPNELKKHKYNVHPKPKSKDSADEDK